MSHRCERLYLLSMMGVIELTGEVCGRFNLHKATHCPRPPGRHTCQDQMLAVMTRILGTVKTKEPGLEPVHFLACRAARPKQRTKSNHCLPVRVLGIATADPITL